MSTLDAAADRLDPAAHAVTSSARAGRLLRGEWLGHAVHPVLTTLPLGAWMCTGLLDLFGDERSRAAAEKLLAFGLLTSAPTALSGLAEWGTTTGRPRRVGIVHAATNTAALGLYSASLVARRRNRHGLGTRLGLAGSAAALAARYLGGHVAIARKVGTRHPAFRD